MSNIDYIAKLIDSMTQKEYKDALERVNEISAEKAKLEYEISKYRNENYKKMAMECLDVMGITKNVIDVASCEIISNVDESVDHYRYGISGPYITTKKTECELRIKFIVEKV